MLIFFSYQGEVKDFRCTIYPDLDGSTGYDPGMMSWKIGDEEVQRSDDYLNVSLRISVRPRILLI